MSSLEVELVEHTPGAPNSGIGRYTTELRRHLDGLVPTHLTTHLGPPFARFVSTLQHVPIGVRDHRPGRLVHFVEDLGCSQMLWRPIRPAVATSHDLGFLAWPPEASMHRPWDRTVWRLSYLGLTRMDAVITVSQFSRRMVIDVLGVAPDRVFAVHSGVDRARFRPIARARERLAERWGLPIGEEDRYVLYVGTEIGRKNLGTLLRALGRLPPRVRLLKVGAAGGSRFRQATSRAVIDLDLLDRVIFLDEVEDEDLVALYSAADAYVCCSLLEGFGQPVLEAMASGTPVICSDVGGLPEVVGDTALVIPPTDDTAVADAIAAVLANETLRQRLAAGGLDRAAGFGWDRTARGVMSVYAHVWERFVARRAHRSGWGPTR